MTKFKYVYRLYLKSLEEFKLQLMYIKFSLIYIYKKDKIQIIIFLY